MRIAVVALMLSGCSLALTSATPHGAPPRCDSIVFPVGDVVVAPIGVILGGAIFVGQSVESGTPPKYYIAPVLLVAGGITALASGFVGFSRIGRCKARLPSGE